MQRIFLAILILATMLLVASIAAFAVMWCIHAWNPSPWAICVVGGVLFAGLSFAVLPFVRRLARQPRFSMKGLLIGIAAVAIYLGTLGRWWLDCFGEHHAIQSVARVGGYVPNGSETIGRPRNALYYLIGFDPFEFDQNRMLDLTSDRAVEDLLARPQHFRHFGCLSFGRGVSSAPFARAQRLNELKNVRVVDFMSSSIDEEGLQDLVAWKTVDYLFFNSCRQVTDAGLA
ncbi:MAG: hypothetical protein WD669_12085, partial [Pirellulales bacterium]